MIDCNIICDLIIIYAADEASAETRQLVETHLESCPTCAKALARAQLAESIPAEWEKPAAKPGDGRAFIGRLQQILFTGSIGILLLFTTGWAIWHRLILRNMIGVDAISIRIPIILRFTRGQVWLAMASLFLVTALGWWLRQHPAQKQAQGWLRAAKTILYILLNAFAFNLTGVGDMPGILFGSLLLLVAYVFALSWRIGQPPATPVGEWGRSLLAAAPLFGLILATVNTITSGSFPLFVAPFFLLIALGITYRRLPRLPHLTSITILFVLLANGLLALRAVQAWWALINN